MKLRKEHSEIGELSEFIEAAVAECDRLSESKEYHLDSSIWHEWWDSDTSGGCYVCLAGAMMANPSVLKENIMPSDFDERADAKLQALEYVRSGEPNAALGAFYQTDKAWDEGHEIKGGDTWLPIEWSSAKEWAAVRTKILLRATAFRAIGR